MQLSVSKTEKIQGQVTVPASKSHTIRAVLIASLARGTSRLINPLFSEDTKAAVNACRALGAVIKQADNDLIIEGFGTDPTQPAHTLDMLNSGTSTNLIIGVLAALGLEAEINGDDSLRSRPVVALTNALTALGCTITFLDKHGCPPLRISGRIKGGSVHIDARKSSQYVSSLLLCCPLIDADTEIIVENPSELPYIAMTLQWLDRQCIAYERDEFRYFKVYGRQMYSPFEQTVPADWSSAAFPLCAAAVTPRSDVLVKGLDTGDVQGDKAVIDYLTSMGADITVADNSISIQGCELQGRDLDINATPDALPALSVVGCYADGTTKLYNVAQARVKETDRISVMAQELRKLHADITELPDGLLIKKSRLQGTSVHGHNDHRIVMALSIAGLIAQGSTTVNTAEAVSVTYPDYIQTMQKLGAKITLV